MSAKPVPFSEASPSPFPASLGAKNFENGALDKASLIFSKASSNKPLQFLSCFCIAAERVTPFLVVSRSSGRPSRFCSSFCWNSSGAGRSKWHYFRTLASQRRLEGGHQRLLIIKLNMYLWLLVLSFAILARQYFAGFYFRDFNRQIWRRGIKFRDLSVLNFVLFFKKSLNFKKFLDKLEQQIFANLKRYFTTEDRRWSLRVKPVSNWYISR